MNNPISYLTFALMAVAATVVCFVPIPADLAGILTDTAKAATALAGLCLHPPGSGPDAPEPVLPTWQAGAPGRK